MSVCVTVTGMNIFCRRFKQGSDDSIHIVVDEFDEKNDVVAWRSWPLTSLRWTTSVLSDPAFGK
jgi:hypothetical protein